MKFNSARIRRKIGVFSLICFVVLSIKPPFVFAQLATDDIKAPIIKHKNIEIGKPDESQIFSATVTDNREIKSVKLFYRFTDNQNFIQKDMVSIDQSSNLFSTEIKIGKESSRVQYYIQAEDAEGNITIKGSVYNPIIIEISGGSTVKAPGPIPPIEPKPRILYYVLGLLAVGALIGLAGGSSGGGEPQVTPCDNSGCQVTLTLPQPD